MSETDPNRPEEPNNRLGRMSRNAALLMMMALLLLLALNIGGSDETVATFSYTEFREHLAADRISEVTFSDRVVEGELTRPVPGENGEDFTSFKTRLPGDLPDALLRTRRRLPSSPTRRRR